MEWTVADLESRDMIYPRILVPLYSRRLFRSKGEKNLDFSIGWELTPNPELKRPVATNLCLMAIEVEINSPGVDYEVAFRVPQSFQQCCLMLLVQPA